MPDKISHFPPTLYNVQESELRFLPFLFSLISLLHPVKPLGLTRETGVVAGKPWLVPKDGWLCFLTDHGLMPTAVCHMLISEGVPCAVRLPKSAPILCGAVFMLRLPVAALAVAPECREHFGHRPAEVPPGLFLVSLGAVCVHLSVSFAVPATTCPLTAGPSFTQAKA